MAQATQSNLDSLLGKLVVEQGLASAQDVEQCRQLQREPAGGPDAQPDDDANHRSLADLLVSNAMVTKRQLARLKPQIEAQRATRQIPGYQILKELGHGAMATVYLGRQLSLDRQVAIKVLPKEFSKNSEFVERFYAEGRAAAKLNHPNIVGAYDVGKAGDFHYFVMEFVEGKTVFDDISTGKRYKEADALRIIMQVASALDHAHKAGFIHRDVKPKNIMITRDGVAKLADMGLARAVSDREAAEAEQGKAYGTPYYISPEQIRGDVDVDFRADIYGLGATFYHMVTGQVPFDGPNPSAVMHKQLKAELVPPDHINPKLTAGLGEIIEVCMAKDRNQRYSTTGDLLDDLEAVAGGEPPPQARKMFDLSALTALESSGQPVQVNGENGSIVQAPNGFNGRQSNSLATQPLFWAAVAGWALVLILLIVLLVGAVT